MKCPPLEIDDRILTALDAGTLVIFAGAGVSAGAPANLGTYTELADRIGERLHAPSRGVEDADRYLARLRRDYTVHSTCAVLLKDASAPTPLHTLLLRLFRAPSEIRIVTTNFDPLFSVAAKQLGFDVPVFAAPTLPLGCDFQGIIHLHGAATDPKATNMVLTADDFGAAYLSRGWARRFLLDLYSTYTVLFIGYSHADVLLQYLAFGLRGVLAERRFALALAPADHWKTFDIVPQPYPADPDPANLHNQLTLGMTAWVAELEQSRSALTTEERLETILRGPAAPSPVDEDFLLRCVKQPIPAVQFARYASGTGTRWIEWLESKGQIGRVLHAASSREITPEGALARWLGREFAERPAADGSRLIAKHGGTIGPDLWDSLAGALYQSTDDRLASADGRMWLAALLARLPGRASVWTLCMLLSRALTLREWVSAVHVFSLLLAPRGRLLLAGSGAEPAEVVMSEGVAGDTQQLLSIWESQVKPALANLADDLAALLEAALRHAHHTDVLAGRGNEWKSPVLYARLRIEHAEFRVFAHGTEALVNMFGDVLAEIGRLRPKALEGWFWRLARAENPILQRFSIFALRNCSTLGASEKFEALRENALLYPRAYGAAREVANVVVSLYRDLPGPQQALLWADLERERAAPETRATATVRLRQYEVDEMIVKIARAFPEDPSARAALQKAIARTPVLESGPLYPERVHRAPPGDEGHRSPIPIEELLALDLNSAATLLSEYEGEPWPRPTRLGLLQALSTAAGEHVVWAMKLIRVLHARASVPHDVWQALLTSVSFASIPTDDALWFGSEVVPTLACSLELQSALARFVSWGATVERLRSAPSRISAWLRVSTVAWSGLRATLITENRDFECTDWLSGALNNGVDSIVRLWLFALEVQFEGTGSGAKTSGWPVELEAPLAEVVSGPAPADIFGTAVLCQHLGYLRRTVPTWSTTLLYRAFDIRAVGDRAIVAWSSALMHGHWTIENVSELRTSLEMVIPRLLRIHDVAAHLVRHVASFSVVGAFDVAATGFVERFLKEVTDDQRRQWTVALGYALQALPRARRRRPWSEWLRSYMDERATSKTATDEEALALMQVAFALPDDFRAAVATVIQAEPPAVKFTLPPEVFRGTHARDEPEAFLRALIWSVSSTSTSLAPAGDVETIYTIMPRSKALLPLWTDLCERLSRTGFPPARKMQREGRKWFSESEQA